jgi:recA bacterial DNA recombination protein
MSSSLVRIEAEGLGFPFAVEPKSAALLKQLSRTPKLTGVTAASRLAIRPAPDTVSCGIAQVDAISGGLPRGCLTEVCGPESSGRTSLLLAALAAATRREEICALIDASDAFHPYSAAAAGINLERLLWIRCGVNSPASLLTRRRRNATSLEEWERRRREDPVEQALRAADLILQSNGFGLVAIDLAGVPLKTARRIPLTTWFRFRRAVENTPTVLLMIGEQFCAQSCASLSLQLRGSRQSSVVSRQHLVLSSRFSVLSEALPTNGDGNCAEQRPSHTELLSGMEIHAEVLHSRTERKPAQSASAAFHTETAWAG